MLDDRIRKKWLDRLLSTDPADRPRAEAAVRSLYASASLPPPRYLGWFDSPFAASWAIGVLLESRDRSWRDLIGAARNSRGSRPSIDAAEAALCRMCGAATLTEARERVGVPLGMFVHPMPPPDALLQPALTAARMALYGDDISALFTLPSESDPLFRAEQRLSVGTRAVLGSGLVCHPTGTLVTQSFYNEYPMSKMAADEEAARQGEVPPIVSASWEVATTAGLWWPFTSGAILSDRPEELHTDEQGLLHSVEGAAAVYRDGARVYAWHGLAVPEEWILHPEAIPPAKLRGFDPAFRKYVESRKGVAPAAKRSRPSALMTAKLPADPAERLTLLRQHAGDLPLFDRYAAGDYTAVWGELVARGETIRHDPLAADALAVAYETMRRVDRNVRTIVGRLPSIGFEFTTPDGARRPRSEAHVAPASNVRQRIQRLEQSVGAIPLSLRVFLEVVGAVDLIGHHHSLAPAAGVVAPDPLVIAGVDELLAGVGSWEDDAMLVLAPDDLHKANTSGGDPYSMAVPDPSADALLLNERHDLPFVDYLRLCFRFGGFPGYEGQETVPAEIEFLRKDLLEL